MRKKITIKKLIYKIENKILINLVHVENNKRNGRKILGESKEIFIFIVEDFEKTISFMF